MSPLFKLQLNDFVKGAIVAGLAAFVWSVGSVFNQAGFDVFSANWSSILSSAFNAAVAALVGYLSKNLLTDENGKILGKL